MSQWTGKMPNYSETSDFNFCHILSVKDPQKQNCGWMQSGGRND